MASSKAGGDIALVSVVGDNWSHQSIKIDPAHEKHGLKWVPNPLMDKNFSPTPTTREIEMPLAKKAFEIIAGKVPFATVPRNHDYDAQWTDSRFPRTLTDPLAPDTAELLHVGGLDNFLAVSGADTPFFKDKQWYVTSFEGGAESAQIFEAGGYRFLHLALSTRCRRAAHRQQFIHDRNWPRQDAATEREFVTKESQGFDAGAMAVR